MTLTRGHLDKINDDVEFYDHQIMGVRDLARRSSFILADDMGLGKAEAVTEPVLTPSGWTTMGQLKVGDLVIGSNGKATEVLGVYPQGQRELVRMQFSDGAAVICDWDHLWTVNSALRKRRGCAARTFTTRQIVDMGLKDGAGNNKHYVPLVAPIEYEPRILPLDPYSLGVLIGDGCLVQKTPNFTSGEDTPWIAKKLEQRLPVGDHLSYCADDRVSIVGTKTRDILRDLGLMNVGSPHKHVPGEYLLGSIQDRLDLLQGLMDTDGTPVKEGGGTEFSTTSDAVANAVVELARSLGGIAKAKWRRTTMFPSHGEMKEGLPSWRINVKLPVEMEPFSLPRKLAGWIRPTKYPPIRAIVDVEKWSTEEAVCIRVAAPDHLYVTTDFVVTHNSLQALTVGAIDFQMGFAKRIIVIATASLKGNWEEEIGEHTSFDCHVLSNKAPQARAKELEMFAGSDIDILIVNYEQVKAHWAELNAMAFDIAIYDEAHYIKNRAAGRTKAAMAMNAGRHFLLTGSPLLNHVDDLWTLLNRVDPSEWPSYWTFRNRYIVFGGYKDKQIVGVKNEAELNHKLKRYMLRRKKEDCLDLPDKQHVNVFVDLLPAQRKLYDQANDELQITLPNNPTPMEIENVLVKYLYLKQIIGTTACLPDQPDASAKLDRAEQLVGEYADEDHPSLLFTQFRKVQECMVDRLRKAGITAFSLNGDVKADKRIPMINEWRECVQAGERSALVSIYSVGGVGLNMTFCRRGIALDELYVPKLNEQMHDRMHRIGADKTQPVQIAHLIARNTIEQRIQTILRRKTKVFGMVVENNDDEFKRKLIEALREQEVAA